MRQFTNSVDIAEMIGDWYLVASTPGHFDARPRVVGASLAFRRDGRSIRFAVVYRTPRRSWTINGRVPERLRKSGLYNWRGSGALLLASRLSWGLARSSDGTVVSAHNPGSMMTNEGLLLLARAGTAPESALATIRREYRDLGIASREIGELSVRVGGQHLDAAKVRERDKSGSLRPFGMHV